MNINILKEALKHYAQSANCPTADRDKVLEAIGECQATIDQLLAVGNDNALYDVCTISSITLSDFLNLTTYDIHGKLARAHGGRCQLSHYIHAVRRDLFLETLTAAQLELGYDYLADLWHDNEAYGEHNPDGTFKRGDDKMSISRNMLRRIRRRLNDKLTVDRDVMEADDIEALLEEIVAVDNAVKR